jgi:hypothetical protein
MYRWNSAARRTVSSPTGPPQSGSTLCITTGNSRTTPCALGWIRTAGGTMSCTMYLTHYTRYTQVVQQLVHRRLQRDDQEGAMCGGRAARAPSVGRTARAKGKLEAAPPTLHYECDLLREDMYTWCHHTRVRHCWILRRATRYSHQLVHPSYKVLSPTCSPPPCHPLPFLPPPTIFLFLFLSHPHTPHSKPSPLLEAIRLGARRVS